MDSVKCLCARARRPEELSIREKAAAATHNVQKTLNVRLTSAVSKVQGLASQARPNRELTRTARMPVGTAATVLLIWVW